MIYINNLSILQRVEIIILSIFFLFGISLFGSLIIIQSQVDNLIYPYTFIDGIDMGNKSKEEALQLLQKRDDYLDTALIEVMRNDIIIATFSGQQLQLARDIDTKVDQAYMIGRSENLSSRLAQQFNVLFHFRDFVFTSGVRYDKEPILAFIQIAEDTYNLSPKNALFTFENSKVTTFKSHANGKEIQSDEFFVDINEAIKSITKNSFNKQIILKEKIIEPELTLAKANDLGIEEQIGEGVSNYSHSIASRIHNVILASSKFNGVIVSKDAIFSFNAYLGDISPSTGYQPAYIIKNGRTVLGDGGGVCQVSTTMFRAVLNTGLPIIERTAHAYRVSYYENGSEPGFDATIFSPTVDLKFKNNTPSAILIETEIDKTNQILKFKIYGKSDKRKVEISPVTIWDVSPPPEASYEDDPTLPSGVIKQVDYASWGAKVRFDYKVYNADKNMTIDKTFYSSYRPWQAVFLRGTGEGI